MSHIYQSEFKFNSPDVLPAIGLKIIIAVDDKEIEVSRTRIILKKYEDVLEYKLADGTLIEGRYLWRYL